MVEAVGMSELVWAGGREALAELSRFRTAFYECLSARAYAFFELTDALRCVDGPTRTPVELSLLAEHQRGYGSLYGALNHGRLDTEALRDLLASLPMPRFKGWIVLAVGVSPGCARTRLSPRRSSRASECSPCYRKKNPVEKVCPELMRGPPPGRTSQRPRREISAVPARWSAGRSTCPENAKPRLHMTPPVYGACMARKQCTVYVKIFPWPGQLTNVCPPKDQPESAGAGQKPVFDLRNVDVAMRTPRR